MANAEVKIVTINGKRLVTAICNNCEKEIDFMEEILWCLGCGE